MSAGTNTPAGTNKAQEVALLVATQRARSFSNMYTEAAPKAANSQEKKGMDNQTSAHAPIVRVTDLQKGGGDEVEMQIVHHLNQRPTMGDRKIAGRGENIDTSTFGLRINQGRHQIDAGGKMSQQRTKHQLLQTARTLLSPYFNRLQDQVVTAHLAGARGDFLGDDTILPLLSDEEFADIMVNDMLPPTYDNHFYGGDATTFEGLDSSDVFSLETVDNLDLYLEEMSNPIQPIRYQADKLAGDEPFYVLNVTPRQWNDWKQSASYADWQQLTANALTRAANFNHPVFKGECAMRGRILVKKYAGMPIRFYTGSTVNVSNNDDAATYTAKTAGCNIDRAMLLGGQALATAYGKTSSGRQFQVVEEDTDAKNRKEVTIAWMNGCKKIRFANKSGRMRDHGVIALDTAVSI